MMTGVKKHLASAQFYFVGAVIVPPIVAFGLGLDIAILAFVLLILAGAVCGVVDPDAPHNR